MKFYDTHILDNSSGDNNDAENTDDVLITNDFIADSCADIYTEDS